MESDVIKIRLKRRDPMRSVIGNQPLAFNKAGEPQILKLGLPNFSWSFNFNFLLVASPL